jgi:hypothetical protein
MTRVILCVVETIKLQMPEGRTVDTTTTTDSNVEPATLTHVDVGNQQFDNLDQEVMTN